MDFLFTEEDLNYVDNLLTEFFDVLMQNDNYKNINKNLALIEEKNVFLPKGSQELFEEFKGLCNECQKMNMCLAYYAGLKKGLSMNILFKK